MAKENGFEQGVGMQIMLAALITLLLSAISPAVEAEGPRMEEGEVHFFADFPHAEQVYLTGDFAGWNPQAVPMERGNDGFWHARVALSVGFHEYKFVVGESWIPDAGNPAQVLNNYGEYNSILYVTPLGEVELRAPEGGAGALLREPGQRGFLYVALIWHQHQPYYLDASEDRLIAPWVRTHTTKDYYDMTSMLQDTPDIHVTMNLTPVLLEQLDTYYVQRIAPYINREENRLDEEAFLAKWEGRTDPWIDLMLMDTELFGEEEDAYLFRNEWSCFSVAHVIMERWPEYLELRDKPRAAFTIQDKLALKCYFYLALFDPMFYEGPVELVTGETVDLSDMVDIQETDGGVRYRVPGPFTEEDANRLVVETVKIAEAVIPLHAKMAYDADFHYGQVELTTTPYFHPILPLIIDVHAGRTEHDRAPEGLDFAYPHDAAFHVDYARYAFGRWFGGVPDGMWPAEGSVSPEAVDLFARAGMEWIASGDGVLAWSTPEGLAAMEPFRARGPEGGEVAVFFRDTHLSDLIGFRYSRWDPEIAAEDFVRQLLSKAPAPGDTALVTVLLDGENAWEWYEQDPDARVFLATLYEKMDHLQQTGAIRTVTPAEYLHGNPSRGVPEHPVESLIPLEELWSGSWIRADFSTWVGEEEENRAWRKLAQVRHELTELNIPVPEVPRDANTDFVLPPYWRAMFAAEGSDWFWWYGQDQNTGEGDTRWDMLYRKHLEMVYRSLHERGLIDQIPEIPSLMDQESDLLLPGGGSMQRGD